MQMHFLFTRSCCRYSRGIMLSSLSHSFNIGFVCSSYGEEPTSTATVEYFKAVGCIPDHWGRWSWRWQPFQLSAKPQEQVKPVGIHLTLCMYIHHYSWKRNELVACYLHGMKRNKMLLVNGWAKNAPNALSNIFFSEPVCWTFVNAE